MLVSNEILYASILQKGAAAAQALRVRLLAYQEQSNKLQHS